MPVINFTPNLKRFFPHLEKTEIIANSLPELLNLVEKSHPGIKNYIVDEQGQLREHVNIFIGNEPVKDREKLSDAIGVQDEIYIMQALSGG
ncbi:MAG: molybdenum cofactor biosynthesis protein MoaD [Cyclobacteriaceae bacterium]